MSESIQTIPVIINSEMNFTYIKYDSRNMDIITENKIRESILYLLLWLNINILNKTNGGYYIKAKLSKGITFTVNDNIYLYNSFLDWNKKISDQTSPRSMINNMSIQPQYIGHQGEPHSLDNYDIFYYNKLQAMTLDNLLPQRDDQGHIVFYCKVYTQDGEKIIPVNNIISNLAHTDKLLEIFPGSSGSPQPHIPSLPTNN